MIYMKTSSFSNFYKSVHLLFVNKAKGQTFDINLKYL